MSYGLIINKVLSEVLPGRVFPDTPPDNVGRDPFAIYQRIGGVPVYPLEGGLLDKENARVLIWIWSTTRPGTYKIMASATRLLAEAPAVRVLTQPADDYNDALKLYGSNVDVSVWFTTDK